MKRILFSLLVLLSFSQTLYAQQGNIVVSSIKYKVTYTADKQILVNDICQLDITKTKSYFYSLHVLEDMHLLEEKWQQANASNANLDIGKNDIRRDVYKFNTIKNYDLNQSIVTENIGGQLLGYVRDTLNAFQWTLLNEKKIINKILCRKAEIIIGKTKSVVWYSTDIPLREGPFYYYGLPGLIVKTSNSLGWEAELISTDFNKKEKKRIEIWPYTLVTKKNFEKAKKNSEAMLKAGKIPGVGNFEKTGN